MVQFAITTTTIKKHKGANTMKYVLLHHTWDEHTLEQSVDYLAKNKAQVSVHYIVSTDGRIAKIGEDSDILRHAGAGSYKGIVDNMNKYAIWIEIVSKGVNFTDTQRKSVRELVAYLIDKHKIPVENIIRHKDYTSRKTDIGDNFWNNEYKTFNDYILSYNQPKDMKLTDLEIAILTTAEYACKAVRHSFPSLRGLAEQMAQAIRDFRDK